MGKRNQNSKEKSRQSASSAEKKEKVVTKYDRKMEARRIQAEQERLAAQRWKIGAILVGICLVCALAGVTIHSVIKKQSALKDTYITVGTHPLTKLEYDYYYNSTMNNYINTYYSYLSYMGLDLSKDFAEQNYSENLTWKDNFDRMAVESITEMKAVIDDAHAQGFEYDTTEDYQSYLDNIKSAASEAEISIARYYTASFGTYATQSNVEPFIKEMLFASAYYDHLREIMVPSEEEITTYYEENKNNYDKVDYHEFQFQAELEEDASEEAIADAMSELNSQADQMLQRLKAGEDFEALCEEYAKEDQKANYSDPETEYSFHADATYFSVSTQYAEWMYEEERTAGELTKVEDTENHVIYIVRLDERKYDETCRTSISDRLVNQAVSEYVEERKAEYTVVDNKGELKYLVVQETTTLSEEESNSVEESNSSDLEESDEIQETTDATDTK